MSEGEIEYRCRIAVQVARHWRIWARRLRKRGDLADAEVARANADDRMKEARRLKRLL